MRIPLLAVHITAGVLAMFAGAAAMAYRKGSRRHASAGNVFVVCMLFMGSSATLLAYWKHQTNNIFGGILTLYLIATAWQGAHRDEKNTSIGFFEWAGFLFASFMGVMTIVQGIQKLNGKVPLGGTPIFMNFFMGSLILLMAIGDGRLILRRGIAGQQRIIRHLWRMCLAWFFATGSFFLGQQQVFPFWLQGSPVLVVFAVLPLVLLVFWLIRVKALNQYRRKPALPTAELSLSTR